MGDVCNLFCLWSAKFSNGVWLKEPTLFRNICSDASMVQDCRNLANTRVRTKKNMPFAKMLHIQMASVIHAWCRKSKSILEFRCPYPTNISLVDRNLQISAILPYRRGTVPCIFLNHRCSCFLNFSRFNCHSFSVNVKIIFKTNETCKNITYC